MYVMDYFGREALYRMISAEVNLPLIETQPKYYFDVDIIHWRMHALVDGVKTQFIGSCTRSEWLYKRLSLLGDSRDFSPTGLVNLRAHPNTYTSKR